MKKILALALVAILIVGIVSDANFPAKAAPTFLQNKNSKRIVSPFKSGVRKFNGLSALSRIVRRAKATAEGDVAPTVDGDAPVAPTVDGDAPVAPTVDGDDAPVAPIDGDGNTYTCADIKKYYGEATTECLWMTTVETDLSTSLTMEKIAEYFRTKCTSTCNTALKNTVMAISACPDAFGDGQDQIDPKDTQAIIDMSMMCEPSMNINGDTCGYFIVGPDVSQEAKNCNSKKHTECRADTNCAWDTKEHRCAITPTQEYLTGACTKCVSTYLKRASRIAGTLMRTSGPDLQRKVVEHMHGIATIDNMCVKDAGTFCVPTLVQHEKSLPYGDGDDGDDGGKDESKDGDDGNKDGDSKDGDGKDGNKDGDSKDGDGKDGNKDGDGKDGDGKDGDGPPPVCSLEALMGAQKMKIALAQKEEGCMACLAPCMAFTGDAQVICAMACNLPLGAPIKTQNIKWQTVPAGTGYKVLTITVGSSTDFNLYDHELKQFTDQTSFEKCDFTGATDFPAKKTYTETGVFYLGNSKNNGEFCVSSPTLENGQSPGMRIQIVIVEAPPMGDGDAGKDGDAKVVVAKDGDDGDACPPTPTVVVPAGVESWMGTKMEEVDKVCGQSPVAKCQRKLMNRQAANANSLADAYAEIHMKQGKPVTEANQMMEVKSIKDMLRQEKTKMQVHCARDGETYCQERIYAMTPSTNIEFQECAMLLSQCDKSCVKDKCANKMMNWIKSLGCCAKSVQTELTGGLDKAEYAKMSNGEPYGLEVMEVKCGKEGAKDNWQNACGRPKSDTKRIVLKNVVCSLLQDTQKQSQFASALKNDIAANLNVPEDDIVDLMFTCLPDVAATKNRLAKREAKVLNTDTTISADFAIEADSPEEVKAVSEDMTTALQGDDPNFELTQTTQTISTICTTCDVSVDLNESDPGSVGVVMGAAPASTIQLAIALTVAALMATLF